ncbi:MAG TPA: hypothetical protein VFQ61_36845 [Polyangiaceae bacterium]|nr:hypothetical protein [Polyangiaceae bacterium]
MKQVCFQPIRRLGTFSLIALGTLALSTSGQTRPLPGAALEDAAPDPMGATHDASTSGPTCRPVRGTFTVETSAGPDCPSAVGLCGRVEWRGDLNATSTFVATSSLETIDSPSTSVLVFTGDAEVSLRGGTLRTKDAIVFRLTGSGDFAEVDTIVGGTGVFANASGAWRASGTFQGNLGQGRYDGTICR